MILAGAVVILIVEFTLFHFNVKKNFRNHSSTSLRLLLKYGSAYFAVDAKRNSNSLSNKYDTSTV